MPERRVIDPATHTGLTPEQRETHARAEKMIYTTIGAVMDALHAKFRKELDGEGIQVALAVLAYPVTKLDGEVLPDGRLAVAGGPHPLMLANMNPLSDPDHTLEFMLGDVLTGLREQTVFTQRLHDEERLN